MTAQALGVSAAQQVSLVLLRTLVGWHFLYEGYFKLVLPGWSRAGAPLAPWSSAGYLHAASGPLAPLLHGLASSRALGLIDVVIPIALVLIGLSLMLGLFTDAGCIGGLLLLSLFYVAAPSTLGVQVPGAEGAYLLVNKTLIEGAAVLVLLVFGTGRLAGLDRLRLRAGYAKETMP
jgi:thiosulfate dehydrogenase [quinone] large subunit